MFTCSVPPPTLLSVNSESRAVALRHYRPEEQQQQQQQNGGWGVIYVDFSRDVIGLSDAAPLVEQGAQSAQADA
ncbi:hypothetical protein MMYC01_205857 [Madurella mycetomatis]|uniref:2EXR domain-containing protein n=1 Tax=Madurella mycetomatis TaxID=100816 RepID=A0A175W6U9_9PEZI|nr:hypothetical protein MMYC01_205857 [Madurella mycetomatis]